MSDFQNDADALRGISAREPPKSQMKTGMAVAGEISRLASQDIMQLDIRDLTLRQSMALKDAVETQIILSRAMRRAAERLDKINEDEDAEPDATMAATVTAQKAVATYSMISTANHDALDQLSATAERLAGVSDPEIIDDLFRRFVKAKRRAKKTLKEMIGE